MVQVVLLQNVSLEYPVGATSGQIIVDCGGTIIFRCHAAE